MIGLRYWNSSQREKRMWGWGLICGRNFRTEAQPEDRQKDRTSNHINHSICPLVKMEDGNTQPYTNELKFSRSDGRLHPFISSYLPTQKTDRCSLSLLLQPGSVTAGLALCLSDSSVHLHWLTWSCPSHS